MRNTVPHTVKHGPNTVPNMAKHLVVGGKQEAQEQEHAARTCDESADSSCPCLLAGGSSCYRVVVVLVPLLCWGLNHGVKIFCYDDYYYCSLL